MNIHAATGRDVAALARIRARYAQTDAFWVERIGGYLQGLYSPGQALERRAIFVAEIADIIAGFVAGHATTRHGCDGELQWIDVAEEFRRSGIARSLLVCIAEWFVGCGLRRVCVNVASDNRAACRLYENCGAMPLMAHWMVWPDAAAMRTRGGDDMIRNS